MFPAKELKFLIGRYVIYGEGHEMAFGHCTVPLRPYSFPFECLSSGRLGTKGSQDFYFHPEILAIKYIFRIYFRTRRTCRAYQCV